MQHSVYFQAATMYQPSTGNQFQCFSTTSYNDVQVQMIETKNIAQAAPAPRPASFEMTYFENPMPNAARDHNDSGSPRNTEKRKTLRLAIGETYVYVKIADILRCEGQGAYTRIFLKDRKPLLVSKSLKEYAGMLEGQAFARVHQSHLISLEQVDQYIKSDGGYILLKDGSKIPVSRSKRQAFLEVMDAVQL